MKRTIIIAVAVAVALILIKVTSPEQRYIRCYNRTKSLEQCVPIFQEKWDD